MTPAPVLLIADHKWRDLPGMTRVAMAIEKRHNVPAIVVSYAAVLPSIGYFWPSAVTLTTLVGPREQRIARIARQSGAAVVVIPTEGLPLSRHVMISMLRSAEVWRDCDLYLPWGRALADFAVTEGYLPGNRVTATGHARFDFYSRPLRQHLKDERELRHRFGLRPSAPIVSWATTFVLASYLDDETRLKFVERDFVLRGLDNLPGFANLPQLAKQDVVARDRAIDWMLRLAQACPEIELLVKPHPYEPTEPYEAFLGRARAAGVHNVHVVKEEVIWDLLNSAKLHIHSGSTTGLEAWLMNVPTINLGTEFYPRYKGAEGGALPGLGMLDDTQTTIECLIDRTHAYLSGLEIPEELQTQRLQYLEQWFHTLDGQAASRQADAIAQVALRPRPVPAARPFTGWSSVPAIARYRINAVLGRDVDAPFFGKHNPASRYGGLRDKMNLQRDVTAWRQRLALMQGDASAPAVVAASYEPVRPDARK